MAYKIKNFSFDFVFMSNKCVSSWEPTVSGVTYIVAISSQPSEMGGVLQMSYRSCRCDQTQDF